MIPDDIKKKIDENISTTWVRNLIVSEWGLKGTYSYEAANSVKSYVVNAIHPIVKQELEAKDKEIETMQAAIDRASNIMDEKGNMIKSLSDSSVEKDSRIKELEDGLREILEGKGAYSPDRLTHCANTVENMKDIAKQLLSPK